MASLRLKVRDGSGSPGGYNENYNALNDGQRGGQRYDGVGNNELLAQLRGTAVPANMTAMQARKDQEGRQVLKLANAEI